MSESTVTVYKHGTKIWKNSASKIHREDGPAIESANGTKEWFQNGHRHRIDGPAIQWANGDVTWCLQGKFIGHGASGFWRFWNHLDDEGRQNVNLHMWLASLTTNA